MDKQKTKDAAHRRWRGILIALGVSEEFLVNRPGKCPLCGGKDRYRWDDKDGGGEYFCNGCGPGDGFDFLMKYHEWDFATTAAKVDAVIGIAPIGSAPKAHDPAYAKRKLTELWKHDQTRSDSPIVKAWLMKRGLSVFPKPLRGNVAVPYTFEGKEHGAKPCMLAQILGPDGSGQSIHRTYLGDFPGSVNGRVKKIMTPVDTIRGGAIRLFPATGTLAIAEGIETAIAVHEMTGLPAWSVVSAGGMESFVPTPEIRNIAIYADNDRKFAGQRAAYILAHRLIAQGFEVSVAIPPGFGTDWLDVHVQQKARVA